MALHAADGLRDAVRVEVVLAVDEWLNIFAERRR